VLSIGVRPCLTLPKDIQSLTTFRRQSSDFLKQLKKTKRPVVLTVNGKAAVIYRVLEKRKQVDVLHIRHGASRKLRPSDLI